MIMIRKEKKPPNESPMCIKCLTNDFMPKSCNTTCLMNEKTIYVCPNCGHTNQVWTLEKIRNTAQCEKCNIVTTKIEQMSLPTYGKQYRVHFHITGKI